MYTLLMGTFDMPAPINYLGSMSVGKYISTIVDRTDPWVLPSQEEPKFPLLVAKVAYEAIFDATIDSITTPRVSEESYEAYFPAWAENSAYSYDYLDMVFPSNEAILEAMTGPEKNCEYLHHNSYFLPELSRIGNFEFHVRLAKGIDLPVNPLPKEGIFAQGNMENISTTILINISIKPDIMENVHIGANCSLEEIDNYTALFKEFYDVFTWSYEEISSIDPSIWEHKI